MVANLPYSAEVERARRDEERRAAANWRANRLLCPPRRRPRWMFPRREWLTTPSTDRQMHGKGLPEYAAR